MVRVRLSDAPSLLVLLASCAVLAGICFWFLTGCGASQRDLAVRALDRAHVILEAAHLREALRCVDAAATLEQANTCTDATDEKYEPLWSRYDRAKTAIEAGEDARMIYCELTRTIPELPTGAMCDE